MPTARAAVTAITDLRFLAKGASDGHHEEANEQIRRERNPRCSMDRVLIALQRALAEAGFAPR
jgi:hypothetical protein